jgi:Ca2+/H+ antiporter
MTFSLTTHIKVALVLGIVMLATMWLTMSAYFPIRDHEILGIVLFTLNYPAILVGMFVSGNPHGPSETAIYFGVFVQWAIIGYFCSWLVARLTRHSNIVAVNSDA